MSADVPRTSEVLNAAGMIWDRAHQTARYLTRELLEGCELYAERGVYREEHRAVLRLILRDTLYARLDDPIDTARDHGFNRELSYLAVETIERYLREHGLKLNDRSPDFAREARAAVRSHKQRIEP